MLKNIVKGLKPSSTLKINEISRKLEDKGEKIFTANCTGCHAKGMNHMAEGKSLSQEDLKINNRHSSAAIVDLITNGKSPMPAFGKSGAISVSDIENVAAYVLKKADAGW